MYNLVVILVGISGISIFFMGEVLNVIYLIKQRLKINRSIKLAYSKSKYRNYGVIGNHIKKNIEAAEMTHIFTSVEKFVFFSFTIATLAFLVGYSFVGFKAALVLAAVTVLLPYYIIIVRLKLRRTYGSREGDVLVFEILNNYRIQSFNMREAIEYTALNIENAPVSKAILLNLSKELNLASSEFELNRALDRFRYAFDTAWANILASNIFFAIYRGARVEKSLEALSGSISKGRQIIEYEKRENYEAWLMIKYLAPVSYVLSIFAGMYFFDLSIREFFYYQFETSTGLKWFLTSLFIYLISVGISKLAASEKLDI